MRQIALVLATSLLCLTPACSTMPAPDVAGTSTDSAAVAAELEALLVNQNNAWNRGDIEGFMHGYWPSPDLRFASGGTVTRGYQQTLEQYRTRYSDRAAMGTLKMSDLETVLLAPDAAVVHGRWALEREGDEPSGLFTLVFRHINAEWVIISDTTTSAD